MAKQTCTPIQRSLAWCQGTPELPGIKRRLYYISKDQIVAWPTLNRDANGRLTSSVYSGNFELVADATWKFIDILPDKSQLTSEAQGEYPSMTQLNKLTAVHPGVGADASNLAAYVNNCDCVFLVETVRGKYRVVGSEKSQQWHKTWVKVLLAPRAQLSRLKLPMSAQRHSMRVASRLRMV